MKRAGVVVVGAGPAGIAAAVRARACGARVTVIDDNAAPGGQIWRRENKGAAAAWIGRLTGVEQIAQARVVAGDPVKRTLLIEMADDAFEIGYESLIIATGARELFLPFPGWTLPGIMGVGGLQALVKAGLPIVGKRIAVAGSGPLLLAAAAYFRREGAQVVILAEQASTIALLRFAGQLVRQPAKLMQAARLRMALLGVDYRRGCWVKRADLAGRLLRLQFNSGAIHEVDYAAIAYGLCPNTELAAALGCRLADGVVFVDDLQRTSVEGIYCAGEPTGIGGVDAALLEGETAGMVAAGQAPLRRDTGKRRGFDKALKTAFTLRRALRELPDASTIVCRCEDVTLEQLQPMTSFREAKLQTRCGMGPCQGRICGAATEFLFGWSAGSVRPPILPARVGTMCKETPE